MSNEQQDRQNLIALYEIYKSELTAKQCEIFELYYYEDYSLSEIANLKQTTRSNIHQFLQKTSQKITNLETNLQVKQRYDQNIQMLQKNKISEAIIKKLR